MTIDHVEMARELLYGWDPEGDFKGAVRIAQVHATLALVEAQRESNEHARIANLVALASMPNINGFENEVYDARTAALMEGLLDAETVPAVPGYGPAGIDEHVFIRADIRKGLGL